MSWQPTVITLRYHLLRSLVSSFMGRLSPTTPVFSPLPRADKTPHHGGMPLLPGTLDLHAHNVTAHLQPSNGIAPTTRASRQSPGHTHCPCAAPMVASRHSFPTAYRRTNNSRPTSRRMDMPHCNDVPPLSVTPALLHLWCRYSNRGRTEPLSR